MKLIPSAVIGAVDIVSSTQIANTLAIRDEFEFKQRFMNMSYKRANEHGVSILNHTGDGFIFVVHREGGDGWYDGLIGFYEDLKADFKHAIQNDYPELSHISSGLRFGVTCGPVMVGAMDGAPSQTMVVGPDVNLAARLCSEAQPNGLVISSRVWYRLKETIKESGWSKKFVYSSPKGFAQKIPTVHVKSVDANVKLALAG